MAIQMRRGLYQDFDPTKMLAGEWAIVTGGDPNTASGRAIYHAFAAGQVERVATYVEAREIIYNALHEIEAEIEEAIGAATDAAETASDAAEAAGEAAQAASDAAAAAEAVLEDGIPLMTSNRRGGAMLGDGLAISNDALGVVVLTNAEIDDAVAAAFE